MDKNDIYNVMDLIKKEIHRLTYEDAFLYSEWIKYYNDLLYKLEIEYEKEENVQLSLFKWGRNYEN